MNKWVKIIFLIMLIVNIAFQIYFFIGASAFFQRPFGVGGMLTLQLVVIPSNILILVSLWLIFRRWKSFGVFPYIIIGIISFLLILLNINLYDGVKKEGWLYDEAYNDSAQFTSDGKYEYYLQLMNQTNNKKRYERLYLKSVESGKEYFIPIELNDGRQILESERFMRFSILYPTEQDEIYELVTTEGLKIPIKKFLVDIEKGVSIRID